MRRRGGLFRAALCATGVSVALAACGGAGGDEAPTFGTAAAGTSAISPAGAPAAGSGATEPSAVEKSLPARVIEALNAARAVPRTCGDTPYPAAGALSWQPQAEQAALAQAQYLQRENQFSHSGANGSTIGDRMSAAGYAWQAVGENLAAGYADFGAVLQGWLDSPGHCANVMNGSFVDVGVVLVQGTASNTYRTYWAMALGRPR